MSTPVNRPLRVLVTDAETRSALAATRSLGRRGHVVFTAAHTLPALASASRFAAGADTYPDPFAASDAFVDAVVALARRHAIDVVLPMTEITTLLVTQFRDSFPASVRVPFGDAGTVARAADKSEVLAIARKVGVPIPETLVIRSPADLQNAQELAYPRVLKPARSRVRTPRGWLSTGVTYVADPNDLRRKLQFYDTAVFPVLLQERIEGPGVGVFALCDRGRTLARFSHRRLREKPPSGGVSVLSESAPLDPHAAEYAERLLAELKWDGVAMVEFKRDRRDGSLRLMEINGRFWGSLQLAIDAGIDFPSLLVQLAAGRPVPPNTDYRVGVRCRWFLGDLDHLLMILLRSRESLNLPPDHPGRLRTLVDFFRLVQPGLRYETWRANDLRPSILEVKHWFKGLLAPR